MEPTVDGSVCTTDISSSFTVYRNKNYQVEMYIVKPNTSTPEHSHPGVENLIMYIGGDIKYVHNGIDIHLTKNSQTPVLRDGDKHALHSGTRGAVFYSIEKWPDGPTGRLHWVLPMFGTDRQWANNTKISFKNYENN
jgi:hypothetical protein